jgi:hypothetical protein
MSRTPNEIPANRVPSLTIALLPTRLRVLSRSTEIFSSRCPPERTIAIAPEQTAKTQTSRDYSEPPGEAVSGKGGIPGRKRLEIGFWRDLVAAGKTQGPGIEARPLRLARKVDRSA